MASGRWYLTDSAVNCYVYAQRWPETPHNMQRAETELEAMAQHAAMRERDALGRELYRSPKRTGGGLRWVVDPRPRAHQLDTRPRVIWVGYSRPPASVWSAPR